MFHYLRLFPILLVILAGPVTGQETEGETFRAIPGLPFVEDFTDASLLDLLRTSAHWSADDADVTLNRAEHGYGPLAGLTANNLAPDLNATACLITRDIDGDGDVDIIMGNDLQPNRLYLNNGAGVFSDGGSISFDGNPTRALVTGDLDCDGDLDLIAGNDGQSNRIYLNNGTPAPFTGVTGVDVETGETDATHALILADLDRDGDLDLITGNSNETNRMYLNEGDGTFIPAGTIGNQTDDTRVLLFEDMNDDGWRDLLVGNAGLEANLIWYHNGTENPFAGVDAVEISIDRYDTRDLAIADVDLDGDPDLFAAHDGQAGRLYLNQGAAMPFDGSAGMDVTPITAARACQFSDLDGDGDMDLLIGNRDGSNRLWLNDGYANFDSGHLVGEETAATEALALTDIDLDGDMDLVVGNRDQTDHLYTNTLTENPFFNTVGSDMSVDVFNSQPGALADVDADGDIDVVVPVSGEANRLYLNNGTATPFGTALLPASSDLFSTRAVALGDVNGDGLPDMITANSNQANRLYLNDGSVLPFSLGSDIIDGETSNSWSVVLADIDLDGDIDMIAGNQGEAHGLYLNNGTATPFDAVSDIDPTNTRTTFILAIDDVDGDGDPDLIEGNYGQVNRLFLNQNGTFPTGVDILNTDGNTRDMKLADVNGDGRPDLLTVNYLGTSRLQLNNGTTTPFGDAITLDATQFLTSAVTVGDMNSDGRPDLILGVYNQSNKIYINQGGSNPFPTGLSIGSGDTRPTVDMEVADFDRDGDLDLYSGNLGQVNRVYMNHGNRVAFSGLRATALDVQRNTRKMVVGDLDRDGRLDLVTASFGEAERFYRNNGSEQPFDAGHDFAAGDTNNTTDAALADLDRDGDLDLILANFTQVSRIHLNDGGSSPLSTGLDIAPSDQNNTLALAVGDVNRDGLPDLVLGNAGQRNRLYLNQGSPSFFPTGADIGTETDLTRSVQLADINGDSLPDLVVGNDGVGNRLYINSGSDPYFDVATSIGSGETGDTWSVLLADFDGDGALDLVAGNLSQPSRLYLNNGSSSPFISGQDLVSGDTAATASLVAADLDGDFDPDLISGNFNAPNTWYRNDGPGLLFQTTTILDPERIDPTYHLAMADIDGDGLLDLLSGNDGESLLYQRYYNRSPGEIRSLEVDTKSAHIPQITLNATMETPGGTAITFFLSNDGGAHFYHATPGKSLTFPTLGNQLIWKAVLSSHSTVVTPRLTEVRLNSSADLQVVQTIANALPSSGETVTIEVEVSNSGPHDASGVVLQETLPVSMSLVSAQPDTGSYDTQTGLWTIGYMANGATARMTLSAEITEVGRQEVRAEIIASQVADPDSTPDNSADEDDLHVIGIGAMPAGGFKDCLVQTYDTSGDMILSHMELEGITDITCNGYQIDDVGGIAFFEELTSLDLGDNQLTTVPDLSPLSSLTTLDLSENRIDQLPTTDVFPTGLTYLNLNGNELEGFVPSDQHLDGLLELYIDFNRLTSLGNLPRLVGAAVL